MTEAARLEERHDELAEGVADLAFLQNELQVIADILAFLEQAVESDAARHTVNHATRLIYPIPSHWLRGIDGI